MAGRAATSRSLPMCFRRAGCGDNDAQAVARVFDFPTQAVLASVVAWPSTLA